MNYTDVERQDDATENKFSKVAWKKAGNQYSEKRLTTKTYGALAQLSDTMGRLGRGDHVPCVWRRASDLQRVLNIGRDALRSRLDELIAEGFLIEVQMHGTPGKRKMYVAKMPDQSEADALLSAVEAFRRYRKIPTQVRDALFWEIEHRGLWDVWEAGPEDASANEVEPEPLENHVSKSEEPTFNCGKPAFRTLYIQRRNQELNRREHAPSPVENSDVMKDAFNASTFESFLKEFTNNLSLEFEPTTIRTLISVYENRYQDTFALRTWFAQKLLRLSSSYKASTIAGYLVADVEEFFHSGTSSEVRPKQQSKQHEPDEPKKVIATIEPPSNSEKEPKAQKEFQNYLQKSLASCVSAHTYNTWFKHLRVQYCDDHGWVVSANDDFVLSWITENYGALIESVCGTKVRFAESVSGFSLAL